MREIIKFRDREETYFYRVYFQNMGGKTIPELLSDLRKKGDFTSPYHLIVTRDGDVHSMRPLEAVAGYGLPYNELGIHILVDAEDEKSMTRIQKLNLGDVVDSLTKEAYPGLERFVEEDDD